jgi:Patatin-like phospholipase
MAEHGAKMYEWFGRAVNVALLDRCCVMNAFLAGRGIAIALLLPVFFLSACSFIPRDSYSPREQAAARIPGVPTARFWLDGSDAELREFLKGSALTSAIAYTGSFDILAISGGAYDGAYGAGVINGWTSAGNRPKFAIVTGVSAGALIAPLAFLGPDYDADIAEAFSGGVAQVLGDLGGVFALLGPPDLRRNSLVDLVDKFLTPKLIAAVAKEQARGRRLLIVTTNLDAQRGTVWDMGAIAASGHPEARELFRDVLVASASIPGVFGPTYIEVEANGHRFREMHVDGGATTQVFIVPDVMLVTGMSIAAPQQAPRNVWIIINNHLTPNFEVIEAGLLPTISRSFSTLIKSSSKQTLFSTAEFVGRDRFHLTYIDNGFDDWLAAHPGVKPGFNTAYMQALYNYGRAKARSGHLWSHEVPLPGAAGLRLKEISQAR